MSSRLFLPLSKSLCNTILDFFLSERIIKLRLLVFCPGNRNYFLIIGPSAINCEYFPPCVPMNVLVPVCILSLSVVVLPPGDLFFYALALIWLVNLEYFGCPPDVFECYYLSLTCVSLILCSVYIVICLFCIISEDPNKNIFHFFLDLS